MKITVQKAMLKNQWFDDYGNYKWQLVFEEIANLYCKRLICSLCLRKSVKFVNFFKLCAD
jgi:hypothetical protein